MLRNLPCSIAGTLTVVALGACSATSSESSELIEPSFDSKSDFFVDFAQADPIDFGDTVSGTFDRDLQFFMYTFEASEGAVITADITHAGSSSKLDTTMFLYRLRGGEEPKRIAADDDEGWGALSRIENFRLYSSDRYAVVVGTKDASGRGNFTMHLSCESGQCTLPAASCPETAQTEIMECMDRTGQELGFDVPMFDFREDECANATVIDSYTGVDARTAPFCLAWAEDNYPLYPRPGVLFEDTAAELSNLVDEVSTTTCIEDVDGGCSFDIALYAFEPTAPPTVAELFAQARQTLPPGPGTFGMQQQGADASAAFETFANRHNLKTDLSAFVTNYSGSSASLGDAQFGHITDNGDFDWNWSSCGGDSFVLRYDGFALVLTEFYCLP